MRYEIQNYLQTRPDLTFFIRENPFWYRLLTRNPEKIYEIERAAKFFYGKTIPQKLDRFEQQMQLAQFLMGLLNGMANPSE